jgi:quercetin dioxygenase-like cupin family protein
VSEPILVPFGGGEVAGDSADRRVEILSEHETLHATWSRFGPHREGADLHVHRLHTDLFYVLEGELTVGLGIEDQRVVVPAGTLASVPPLVVHGFRNASDAELRYLNFHAPGVGFADYLRAMRDGRTVSFDQHPPPPDGGRPRTESIVGADGFVSERPGLRIALLADVEEIGISEAWSEPGSPSPPTHLHRRHVESFYVLEGEMTFTAGGRELRAEEGSWVQVPPGVPHTFAFPGDRSVRFLNVHTPSCGFGAFVRGLHEASTDEELAAVRAAFDQIPA